jgi:hypothetical protein
MVFALMVKIITKIMTIDTSHDREKCVAGPQLGFGAP